MHREILRSQKRGGQDDDIKKFLMVPSTRISAGLLMYRKRAGHLEVFLIHPGGPFWVKKDEGVWSIPKGEINPGEELLKAAMREFSEEVGLAPDSQKEFLPLGEIKQKGGKTVHAWAFEGDLDPLHKITGGQFTMEWPPRSGKTATFPEVDRGQFFTIAEARKKLIEAQHPFLERLVQEFSHF